MALRYRFLKIYLVPWSQFTFRSQLAAESHRPEFRRQRIVIFRNRLNSGNSSTAVDSVPVSNRTVTSSLNVYCGQILSLI
jgi:hypothetical protein